MFDFNAYSYSFQTNHLPVHDELMIFHCNHYNCYLQRSILDAEYIDSTGFLIGAAAECAYRQLQSLFKGVADLEKRKALTSDLYRLSGYGLLPLQSLTERGGVIRTRMSHYTFAWKQKFGAADRPMGFFHAGFAAGAFAAIHSLPLKDVQVKQSQCMSMGHAEDVYELSRGPANFDIYPEKLPISISHFQRHKEPETQVQREAITQAVAGMPLLGNEQGLIPAFGVFLTRMYADYYNRISYEFEKKMVEVAGTDGIAVSKHLFVEAGHQCAFNTFGGIMTSVEWAGLILPQLKTREDWVFGITSVVNALGWGTWQVINVNRDGALFEIWNDYESLGFARMYKKPAGPTSYLATGGAAGLLNLIYLGNIHEKPELTPEYYEKLFKSSSVYVAEQVKTQAMGQPLTAIRVYKS